MNHNHLMNSLGAALLMSFAATSQATGDDAKDYPSKPITVIVPYAAGGNADSQARALAPCLGDELGGKIRIVNRPGSAGAIGTREVAKAKPDGYTLSVNSVTPYVLGPLTVDNVGYTTQDLQTFGFVSSVPIVVFVGKDSKFKTLKGLMDAAKDKSIVVAVPGKNSLQDLLVQKLEENYGAKFNVVPTDSMTEIIRGVNAGDYAAGVTSLSKALFPRVENKDVIVLARGGAANYPYLSGVPTYQDAGYGDLLPSTEISVPLAAPGGIPSPIATKIETALKSCLAKPSVKASIGEKMVPTTFVDSKVASGQYENLSQVIAKSLQEKN